MTAANDNGVDPGDNSPQPARPCPICGRPSTTDMRPFCSKRCADVDLHRWLGGSYAIPAAPDEDDPFDDEPA